MNEKLPGITYWTGWQGTAYDPLQGGMNGEGDYSTTASGTKWVAGRTIAVAPLLIPYGSVVAVHVPAMPQYSGIYLAEDTGGLIRSENGGKRVDILITGKANTAEFGRKPIEVAILEMGTGVRDAREKAKNWAEIKASFGGDNIGSGGGSTAAGEHIVGDASGLNKVGKAFQYNQNMVLGTAPNVEDDQYPAHRYANNPFVLRIGDTQMFIPPINISSNKITMIDSAHTLRSKSPTVNKSGWTTNKLDIQLIFADTDQINGWKIPGPGGLTYHMDGLRSLLAQFYKNPFLPIRNELINDRLGIFNVALYNINITTSPGMPGMLIVDLSLIECTMEPLLGLPDFMYDMCFNYPLWRWFYQQMLLDEELTRYSGTYLRPVPKHMTSDVFFRVLDPDSIEKMKQDVLAKARQNANATGKNTEQMNLEYALYQFKMNDIAQLMTDWEMGDIVCTNVMVGINKELTPIQMETYEMPMFQDVGGMNRVFVLDFTCTDRDQLESLHAFVRHNELMAREYRHRFVGGFIEVHNEIVNMCGIQHAMVTGIETTTVPGQSEIFSARVSFQEFNVNQKNNERLQGINSTLETFADRMGKDFEDVFHIENKTNRKPVIVYEGMMEHAIKQMELYPDLELPSYNTVDKIIPKINAFREKRKQSKMPFDKLPRPSSDIWCEPDFYMIYPQIEDAFRAINAGDLGGKMIQLLIDGTYEDIANLDDGMDDFSFEEFKTIPDRLNHNFVDNSFNPYEAQEKFKETVSLEIYYANEDYSIDAFTDWGGTTTIPKEQELASMMMHDMVRYDAKYRISRAFPTYMVLFVDEGQWVDGKRLWNSYYAYHAIHEIIVTRDKDNPVDLAYLRLANTYGTFNKTTKLTDPRNDTNEHSKSAVERAKNLWDSFWNFSAEDVMVESRQIMEHAELSEGARIHIRMGYSSNTGNLPICFNGHIASVNDGPNIEIVAQGDGVELIAHPVSTKHGEGTPNEAHNAFQKYLTKRQNNYFFSISEHLEFFNNFESKYGIEHFGWVESLAGGEPPAIIRNFWRNTVQFFKHKSDEKETDGEGLSKFFNNIIVDNVGFMSSVITGTPNFNVYDVMKNIYRGSFESVTGVTNYESFNWSAKDFLRFGLNNATRWKEMFDGEKNVNFSAYNKTLWDIGQQFSMFVPEFICAPHHHGFRSTLFFGMPHWPVKYEYYKKPGLPVLDINSYAEKYKPFQQMHVYVAGMDIIANNIQASSEHIRHVATGIYSRGDLNNISEGVTVYADRSIMSDQQKGMIVDTGVFQDIFGHDATIDFIMKYIAKPTVAAVVGVGEVIVESVADMIDVIPFGWADDTADAMRKKLEEWDISGKTNDFMAGITQPGKVAAESVTIGALQRNFMEMYQGELIIVGDPAVKPWDIFYLNDPARVMSGTVQVGKVTHMLSRDSGFTTLIKPDLLVSRTDGRGGRNAVLATATAIATATGLILARKLAASKVFRWVLGATTAVPWRKVASGKVGTAIKKTKVVRTASTLGDKLDDVFFDGKGKTKGAKWLKRGVKLVKGNIFLALLTGGITEHLMTWWDKETKYNNVIYIYPLWKGGQPFAAGIKGAAHIIPNYIDPRFSDPKGAGIINHMGSSSTIAGVGGKNSDGKYDGSLSGLIHPLMQPTLVTSPYSKSRTLNGVTKPHDGIDLGPFSNMKDGHVETNIYAVADGVVEKVTELHSTAGNWIIIRHSNLLGKGLYYTGYMHMKTGSMTVKVGDNVDQGTKIGIMGTTGGSTGIHLHFEVLKGSSRSANSVNPAEFYKSMGASLT